MDLEKKYILSIESTGRICSVALLSFDDKNAKTNFELLSEYSIYVGNKHDRFLAELCCRILNDNDLQVSELSAIAVSIGPGSFTGLRIGSAIAKGLCFDDKNFFDDKKDSSNENNCPNKEENHSIKIIAVPTLKTLACRVSEFFNSFNDYKNHKILSIIPSHSDLVYTQLFDASNNNLTEIEFVKIEEVKEKYAKDELLFLSTNYKIELDFGIYLPEFSRITAATVGKLAVQMYKKNEFTNPDTFVPLYIQDFIPR